MASLVSYIAAFIQYGIDRQLIEESDRIFVQNRIISLLYINSFVKEDVETISYRYVSELLQPITQYALDQGIIEDTQSSRDCFDSMVMNVLIARPSAVIHNFNKYYQESPQCATQYYYALASHSNYIRQDRIAKNHVYQANTPYGEVDITINLSKPEKDPRDIAAMNFVTSQYPLCPLCKENEGYQGNPSFDGRSNHRIIPLTLCNERWFLQYSPYVYYNEHCIVFHEQHIPMKLCEQTFSRLLEFVVRFPHYFVGTNADLPIVGGSILSHDHFQGGCYDFAMSKASIEKDYPIQEGNIQIGRVAWPLSVLRVKCKDTKQLCAYVNRVYEAWKQYDDPSVELISHSKEVEHNTITPIARKRGDFYEMDIVLRNNRTSEEHPYGIFHPHEEIHHIKKENIGLIEVMGLAVLPARLQHELKAIVAYVLGNKSILSSDLVKHEAWIKQMKHKYVFTSENITTIIEQEVAAIFMEGLSHCGVFKRDEVGIQAFDAFVKSLEQH